MPDMVPKVWEKIAEYIECVENCNFITESIEAAVSRCSGINSNESTRCGAYLQKASGQLEIFIENILKDSCSDISIYLANIKMCLSRF